MGFREKLRRRQEKIRSIVCIGLDPLPEKCPQCLRTSDGEVLFNTIFRWMAKIVNATASYACMYKLQRAHYESVLDGEIALRSIIRYLRSNYFDVPILLDCKRGDISRTQSRYKIAHFEIDGADGLTFNPYMGFDVLQGLVDEKVKKQGKALVGLCYTSNPAAREIQDVRLFHDGKFLWEYIAEKVLEWTEKLGIQENAGLVMAAAYESFKGSGDVFSYHLKRMREIVRDKLWFLIPGVGTQGGAIKETVENAWAGWGSMTINSSSGIIFASTESDFAEAAGKKAKQLRDEINKYIP